MDADEVLKAIAACNKSNVTPLRVVRSKMFLPLDYVLAAASRPPADPELLKEMNRRELLDYDGDAAGFWFLTPPSK